MKRLITWRNLAIFQGLFYLVTGIWPLVHMRSFLKITGPKTDLWLVKTVALLISMIGSVLGLAGLRKSVTPEIAALAAGSAASLSTIDAVYVSKKSISPVYLLDAFAELALITAWGLGLRYR